MCEIKLSSCGHRRLVTSDGEHFKLQTTGCQQGIAVFNMNGQYITAIELENAGFTSKEDLEVICAALTSIKATAWLRKSEKRLARLKEDIAARMKEKNMTGELLTA